MIGSKTHNAKFLKHPVHRMSLALELSALNLSLPRFRQNFLVFENFSALHRDFNPFPVDLDVEVIE